MPIICRNTKRTHLLRNLGSTLETVIGQALQNSY